jgi:hypothetical protein
MENSIRVARLGYLFDAPLKDCIQVLRAALPELPRVFELGDMLTPRSMQEFLPAALVAKEKEMTSWLAELHPEAFRHPQVETSEVHYMIVDAEQAGALGDRTKFAAAVAKLRPGLDPQKLIIDPKEELAIFGPVVALLEAVSNGDQTALDKAWVEAGTAWKNRYGRAAEVANFDGILDLEVLGIGRVAQQFGLTVPATNPYAPADLLAAADVV